MTIGKTLSYYWKLRAIESIGMSSNPKLREEEIIRLIDALVDDQNIKDILIKSVSPDYSKRKKYHIIKSKINLSSINATGNNKKSIGDNSHDLATHLGGKWIFGL